MLKGKKVILRPVEREDLILEGFVVERIREGIVQAHLNLLGGVMFALVWCRLSGRIFLEFVEQSVVAEGGRPHFERDRSRGN